MNIFILVGKNLDGLKDFYKMKSSVRWAERVTATFKSENDSSVIALDTHSGDYDVLTRKIVKTKPN